MEDAPLSDRGDDNEDVEMVDAEVIEAERPDSEGGSAPRHSPDPEEVPEQTPDQPEENPRGIAGEEDPQVPQDPQDDSPQPHRQVLQGTRKITKILSILAAKEWLRLRPEQVKVYSVDVSPLLSTVEMRTIPHCNGFISGL